MVSAMLGRAIQQLVACFVLVAHVGVVSAQGLPPIHAENAQGLAEPPAGPATVVPTVVPETTSGVPASDTSTLLPPVAPLPSPADAASTMMSGDPAIDGRMRLLDNHLSLLASRRSGGIGDGLVTLLLGATYTGLGVYANRHSSSSGNISRYFFVSAAGSFASAGVHFGLQPNAGRMYARFQLIAADTSLTPGERLSHAEQLLHSMARRRMAARYVQSGINIGITLGSLPVLFGSGGFDTGSAFDWMITLSAGISVISAVSTMFQRSEEERRWSAYRAYTTPRPGFQPATGLRLQSFGAAPIPGGGSAAVRFVF